MAQTIGDFVAELIKLDQALFEKINSQWTNRFTDWFFPNVTDLHTNIFFVLSIAFASLFWIWRERWFATRWILAIIASVSLSDSIAYRLIKYNVDRPRPPASGVPCIIRGPSHTGPSFPSNHASNMFAAAATVAGISPPASIPIFFAAALVAYSRVYVGAHFPLDVVGGAILGIFISLIMCRIFAKWLRRPDTPSSV